MKRTYWMLKNAEGEYWNDTDLEWEKDKFFAFKFKTKEMAEGYCDSVHMGKIVRVGPKSSAFTKAKAKEAYKVYWDHLRVGRPHLRNLDWNKDLCEDTRQAWYKVVNLFSAKRST